MSKCIKCGKYIERTYAPSECLGMYCQDCAKKFYVNDDKDWQIDQLKQQLAEKDKMHLLDEQEFQHYCAYKNIEPEIKGCLDREREYKKQLAEKNLELKKWSTQYAVAYVNRQNALIAEKVELQQQLEEKEKEIEKFKDFIGCKGCIDVIKKSNENETQLAIQELEKARNSILCNEEFYYKHLNKEIEDIINQQIKELKGE